MKIGVLTSSRADYGIYLPLLQKLKSDIFFELELISFGTHLSPNHGYTVNEIKKDGYRCIHSISSLICNDDEEGIATSYGLTIIKFANFWNNNKFDLVLCLGDRFEMSAAVQAGIPYNIKFCHIHGGETTLGAIDNIYRDQISIASFLHFTASEQFSSKVIQLIGSEDNIYTIGSLSLDGIERFKPISVLDFYGKFKIPKENYALVTFHPETVNSDGNAFFAAEMRKSLSEIISKLFLVITMPNADTMGSVYREEIKSLQMQYPKRVVCIENFGKERYFSAMYYSKLMIGNTSSGILEAASFGKFVVNVGDRQKGRLQSKNIFNVPFLSESIVKAVNDALLCGEFKGKNIFYKKGTVDKIIEVLKERHGSI